MSDRSPQVAAAVLAYERLDEHLRKARDRAKKGHIKLARRSLDDAMTTLDDIEAARAALDEWMDTPEGRAAVAQAMRRA